MLFDRCRSRSLAAFAVLALAMLNCSAMGAESVEHSDSPGAFPIVAGNQVAVLGVDGNDFPGVIRAANDLADDIGRVSGKRADVIQAAQGFPSRSILIGTVGKSAIIDGLVRDGKIDVTEISGKWESYVVQVVTDPLPGVDSALVIAGSDKRGTIFGIYDLSEKMGVSPWYWWADVPVRHRDALFVRAGRFVQGPPKVKYRGIFINDEEPALGPWSREKFGGVNSRMYAHMFELILRLKGNYLWPAMWGKSFTEDDPESPRLADEYGIVIGTSHHEPMMRAQQDWPRHHQGIWSYATNQAELKEFWQQGIERNKNFETLITIGMRGDGDEPMVKGGDMQSNTQLLEQIVADQRKMIASTINPDVTKVPQVWALYKEVADYYDHGMRVPDDVTLLWCDDNWGNIRRVPTAAERKRSGGAGIYYHFDYVGGPRSYKWINTNPLPKVWEQMNLAYQNGADRIWIVNVGDLKPMEIPIEFFLRMAWDPDAMPKEKIADFTRHWAEREFGAAHAEAIADIVTKYAKYNGWRKPELLEPTTFSLVNFQEAERVLEDWQSITADAEKIYAELPAGQRDAFYQLVLYPTKASATVAELYIAAGRNRLYARQQRASTNDQADRVVQLFKQDQDLSDYYNHTMSGGKWNHMMDEIRIGYTSWNTPKKNIMPEVTRIQVPQNATLGVAIEGSESAWPGADPVLPAFDSINQQRYWIDVFNRGKQPFEFTAKSDQSWIQVSESSGKVEKETRVWVTVDWSAAPAGNASGTITLTRTGGETVPIKVEAVRSAQFTRDTIDGAFGGLTGPIAIAAESATKNIEADGAKWEKIPDYGRGISGMEVFPVTAPGAASPPQGSPCLEYKVLIANPGEVQVDLVTSPTLDYVPGRGLRLAVSFDDQQPQILDAYAKQGYADPSKRADLSSPAARDWGMWVQDNARTLKSSHNIGEPGIHTLKVWMVDPGVVLQKLIVHQEDLRPSYFGPPEADSVKPRPGSSSYPSPRKDANSMAAHQQLLAKARAGGIDLYFLGDSITRRWGCSDPQWSGMFANWKQNFFGWNAADFGWGADTIQNILWRIQNGELDHVNPKVIVILAGTNNVGTRPGDEKKVADIVGGLSTLILTCRERAPGAKIIVTAIFPRNDSMAVWPEIQQINSELARLADDKTIFYLNVNDKLAGTDGVLFDGMTVDKLHPTARGYQVWADGLQPLLTQFLGPRAATDHAPPATGDPSVQPKPAGQP